MSLPSFLSSKVLLYVIGALAMALLLMWARTSSLSLQRDVAMASRDAAATEKQAWKSKATELVTANAASQKAIDDLRSELKHAQGERRRLQADGQAAIDAAKADAADADRTLKAFVDRYAHQLQNPDCAGALNTLQRVCPALDGY